MLLIQKHLAATSFIRILIEFKSFENDRTSGINRVRSSMKLADSLDSIVLATIDQFDSNQLEWRCLKLDSSASPASFSSDKTANDGDSNDLTLNWFAYDNRNPVLV